jgi:hypothetical protein
MHLLPSGSRLLRSWLRHALPSVQTSLSRAQPVFAVPRATVKIAKQLVSLSFLLMPPGLIPRLALDEEDVQHAPEEEDTEESGMTVYHCVNNFPLIVAWMIRVRWQCSRGQTRQ